jgi:hydroxyacylglutathione hydrolase
VLKHVSTLPRGGTLVLTCQSGGRSLAVASALRNRGFGNIAELAGSYDAWLEYQLGSTPAAGTVRG